MSDRAREVIGDAVASNVCRSCVPDDVTATTTGVLAALEAAGIVLVELPEPTGRWAEGPEWRDFIPTATHAVVWTGDQPDATVMVQNIEPGSLTPAEARALAAALLAAANRAEASR